MLAVNAAFIQKNKACLLYEHAFVLYNYIIA